MQKAILFVRKYPLSMVCFALIWFLSFFTPPKTELDEVPFMDKWVHFIMYGGACAVLWIEYLRNHIVLDYEKLFFYTWLCPILMSGLIELLQEYCTAHRQGDWLDLAANATGVTLGAVFGLAVIYVRKARKNRYKNTSWR